MNYLDKQIFNAKENYNYFFVKLIFELFKILIKISFVLVLCSFFNNIFINIIAGIYLIYAIYFIYFVITYYFNIINDIKETLGYDNLFFEIDLRNLNGRMFMSVVKYGK